MNIQTVRTFSTHLLVHINQKKKIALKIAVEIVSVNLNMPPLASFNLPFPFPELFLQCPLNIYGNMAIIGSIIQHGFEISAFN
jgi:hypothetical protein